MRRRSRYFQPRVEGGRDALPSCVLKEIREKVNNIALEYGVSRSWVVSTILADALKVKGQLSYKQAGEKRTAA